MYGSKMDELLFRYLLCNLSPLYTSVFFSEFSNQGFSRPFGG
jgi:hypothetical protein